MSTGIINQALEYIADYQPGVQEVTLPYTPTKTGLLIVVLRTSAVGRGVETYYNATPQVVDGYNVNRGYICGTVFVEKGKEVSTHERINIESAQYYFVPLSLL